jgi:hypothetical protein
MGAGDGCSVLFAIPALILGIVLGAIGGGIYAGQKQRYLDLYNQAEPKPSDEQIDHWHDLDTLRICEGALAKLDLIPEQVTRNNPEGPLVLEGAGTEAKARVGADGRLRFSRHEILIVYLTDYHLASYKCLVELESGLVTEESTSEYHYGDVVAVTTQAETQKVIYWIDDFTRGLPTVQKFSLSVASGQETSITVRVQAEEQGREVARYEDSRVERAIRTIRARLREKKGGTAERTTSGPELHL